MIINHKTEYSSYSNKTIASNFCEIRENAQNFLKYPQVIWLINCYEMNEES